jgi:uncharacterized membrane protein
MTIRNPVEWIADESRHAGEAIMSASRTLHTTGMNPSAAAPQVRRITIDDLKDVIARGMEDFGANRTDVIFLCVLYPVLGLVFARVASGSEMLPLLFPLASGFALVGPLAGVGLYEMSRLREQGREGGWAAAFGVVRSPSFGSIVLLGLMLGALFAIWLIVAHGIFAITLGPQPPASITSFLHDVLLTRAGWAMVVLGVGVGFLFAVLVLAIGAVSFPLLLDRNVGVETAVVTSVRAVAANPGPMALWGIIVAVSLVVGSIPLFFGLVIVLPVLGHSTWHLYRKLVTV